MASQVTATWSARAALVAFIAAEARAARRAVAVADVVHAHWWFPSGIAGALGRRSVPLVTTLHGSDVRLAVASRGARAPFRFVARRSSAITTVSRWLAREAEELGGMPPPRVMPMPVATELFYAGADRRPASLLFIGKLTAQKGVEEMLRSLAAMRVPATLHVVGAGRVDDADQRALANDLGLADRIVWHPLLTQRELAALYRQCAIHVIPARGEGLGLTAVEALLSETPVVAFASGGLPDVVSDGITGRLVPVGDVAALAHAVDDLLSRREVAASYGQVGRQWTLATFSPSVVGASYAALYRDVAGRLRRP